MSSLLRSHDTTPSQSEPQEKLSDTSATGNAGGPASTGSESAPVRGTHSQDAASAEDKLALMSALRDQRAGRLVRRPLGWHVAAALDLDAGVVPSGDGALDSDALRFLLQPASVESGLGSSALIRSMMTDLSLGSPSAGVTLPDGGPIARRVDLGLIA